jgi:hypothetical protein
MADARMIKGGLGVSGGEQQASVDPGVHFATFQPDRGVFSKRDSQ